jgi:LmeA-like phospholipid-binding
VSEYPTAPMPLQQAPPRRRRRSRRWLYLIITLVVVLALLVIADRAAAAYAENKMATQIQKQGFSSKPNVSIEGFPFLTQVIGHDLHNVTISSAGVKEGPVDITNINADLQGVHLNSSFSGGTIDHVSGTALITFGDLLGASGDGPNVTVTAVHGDEVTFNVDLAVISGSATARVTQVGNNKIHVQVISADGLPTSLLGSLADFTVTVPSLPLNMTVQSVKVSAQGVLIHVTGDNVSFSQ